MRDEADPRAAPGEPAGTAPEFPLLVERLADRVYRYLRAWCGDAETARDLTQETFLNLARTVGSAAGRISPAYVFVAARNTALSFHRKRRTERRHLRPLDAPDAASRPAAGPGSDPGRSAEHAELERALEEALARLPEELRTVFLLSEVEGLRYREIADVVGCPPGTVASRKFKAVKALRSALAGRGFDPHA
jgi:RNA polymerase sigma-70 factor (ECF subfamily)